MTRPIYAIGSALGVVILGLLVWWAIAAMPKEFSLGEVEPSVASFESGESYQGAPLSADYKNETFRFSLDTPEGFTAGELPPDESGGTAIVLQNEKGEGIQIYIVPGSEQNVLTAEDIRASIPDMEVSSPEVVEIGNQYKGVAFLSDNSAFGGASREVWFYYKGNLYQISTYLRLDALLKAMFLTWRFY